MKNFDTFVFESFQFDKEQLQAKFYYSFDNGWEIFEEIIDFKCEWFNVDENILGSDDDSILNNFLFQLHLALWISNYKLFPTQKLEIKSGYLDDDQIAFWEKFYRNWLGEFFITNKIDPNWLINFVNAGSATSIEELTIRNNYIESSKNFIAGKSLLLWWGGKDSIVSYSLLKNKKKLDLFVFGKVDAIKKSTSEITWEKLLLVKRTLSKNLFRLNKQGYYNGHVPITGIIAFSTFVVWYLYWYSNIILSNEASASESNTDWMWISVNHQYSKSLEFEKDLLNYSQNYISKWIHYFSLLRGMYEYKIASIFAKQKDFFNEFSSCNRNFKINSPLLTSPQGRGKTNNAAILSPFGGIPSHLLGHTESPEGHRGLWCCECEKCAFVYLILSPFLEEGELINIFWENLFEKEGLEKTFRELIWLEKYKPFECVWTYEESLLSAKKVIQKYWEGLPIVLQNIKSEVLKKCDLEGEKKLETKLLKIGEEDIIPQSFRKYLI